MDLPADGLEAAIWTAYSDTPLTVEPGVFIALAIAVYPDDALASTWLGVETSEVQDDDTTQYQRQFYVMFAGPDVASDDLGGAHQLQLGTYRTKVVYDTGGGEIISRGTDLIIVSEVP